MTRNTSPTHRRRILVRMTLLVLAFLSGGALLSYVLLAVGFISAQERMLYALLIILPGIFMSGLYGSKRLAEDWEEFAMGTSMFLMLSVLIGILFFQFHLEGLGTGPTVSELILRTLLIWLPSAMIIGFSANEVLVSLKVKKPLVFHVKRFVGRAAAVEIYLLVLATIFWLLVLLIGSLLPERHVITIAIVSIPLAAIPTYLMLFRRLGIRQLFRKIENSDK